MGNKISSWSSSLVTFSPGLCFSVCRRGSNKHPKALHCRIRGCCFSFRTDNWGWGSCALSCAHLPAPGHGLLGSYSVQSARAMHLLCVWSTGHICRQNPNRPEPRPAGGKWFCRARCWNLGNHCTQDTGATPLMLPCFHVSPCHPH